MPVTSTDFIELAKFCASRKDEIGYRNAVARAYYGAYHHGFFRTLSKGRKIIIRV